ncbi:O-methyltransferase [Williamsia sp. M5A3_1d]
MTDTHPAEVSTPAVPRPVTPSTILAEVVRDMREQLEAIDGLDRSIIASATRAEALAAGLDPYLDLCTTAESEALADLARRTAHRDWDANPSSIPEVRLEQEMLSGHVEGQALKFLVFACSARRVLEIGMFTGYSALAMAEELGEGSEVVACEIDAEVAAFARDCFDRSPVGDRIAIEVGPAGDTLRRLDDRCRAGEIAPFDFVFIDADKPGYLDYLDTLLEGSLLAPRALIAVDNTLLQGEPYATGATPSVNGSAVATFNAALTYDNRVEQVVLPLRDGLTLIRRVPDRAR